jgi:SAM-dependent methyltransferase
MDAYAPFANVYDLFYAGKLDDIQMYAGFAERAGDRVLEIGVGTARVAHALALLGYTVHGIDVSDAMLALARRKVDQRVALTRADMRDFDLGARFDLVIAPINTFMHNLTLDDQLAALACIKRHLTAQGLLVLDLFNPDPTRADDRRMLLRDIVRGPHGKPILHFNANRIDWERQIASAVFIVDEPDESARIKRTVFTFELRFLLRNEVELLMRQAGFVLDAVYGSYSLEPFESGSEKMIVVARTA